MRQQTANDPSAASAKAEDGPEKRSRPRVDLATLALIMKQDETRYASLLDISGLGARFAFEYLGERPENGFERDDEITVLIHGFHPLPSRVIRATDDELAVKFTIDEAIEDAVIAQIMITVNKLEGDIPTAEVPKPLSDAPAEEP